MHSSINFIARRGCFEITLRYTCIILGSGLLCLLGIEALLSPKVIQHAEFFVNWAICFVCNALLMFGATIRNKWVIGIWLINPLIVFIIIPAIEIITRISEKYGYKDDPYQMFCEYTLHLCVYFITGRYVISYIVELHKFDKFMAERQRALASLNTRVK